MVLSIVMSPVPVTRTQGRGDWLPAANFPLQSWLTNTKTNTNRNPNLKKALKISDERAN